MGAWTKKKPMQQAAPVLYGKDGIRTHVELPPNGFQDRLVMTASIPFQARVIW